MATSFEEPAGRLTLLYTIGANGTLLDPYVLLKGDRNQEITDKIISDIFKHWIIGRNERSFITSEHFLRYLKEVFHPQTKSMLEAQNLSFKDQPRLLIMDGHSSHISTDAQVFADRMNIEFLFIPSHSSALLQPLDINFFNPFKNMLKRLNREFYSKDLSQDVLLSTSTTKRMNQKKPT